MTKKESKKEKESEAIVIEGANEQYLETLENEINLETSLDKDNEWLSDIKADSLIKALEVGVILPNFRPYKNTVYKVKIVSKPRKVITETSQFFSINIEKDNMRFSMNMNNSFRFQLALILKRYKMDINDLIGKFIYLSKDDIGYINVQLIM